MKRVFFTILITLFFASLPLWAETNLMTSESFEYTVKDFFPSITVDEIEILKNSGRIDKWDNLALYPQIPEKAEITSLISASEFNIITESIFLIKDPPSSNNFFTQKEKLEAAFESLSDINSLKGINYYSNSKKKDRVLFTEVSDVKVIGEYPNQTITALVEDSTFDENLYKIDYKIYDSYIAMEMVNLEKLKYSVFTVSQPMEMIFSLTVIPTDEGLLLYCAGVAKTIKAEFLKKRVTSSVSNRVTALYNWFKNNYPEKLQNDSLNTET